MVFSPALACRQGIEVRVRGAPGELPPAAKATGQAARSISANHQP